MAEEGAQLYAERYRLMEVLGRGTTASVYRCEDTKLGEARAIKILSPQLVRLDAMRKRFQRETALTSRLHHANIVPIHDVGVDGNEFFLVMDIVEGGTIREKLNADGPMPPRKAINILQSVLHALHYAHAQGVAHRDIKPRNIMLKADGTAVVTDFGIARVIGDDTSNLTRPGVVMGTWGYMAPEQRIDAALVDNRTDIYAAGATLYTMITDRRPPDSFLHDTEWKEGIPEDLIEVFETACHYQPAERYQTAREMAAELVQAGMALKRDGKDNVTLVFPRFESGDEGVRERQLDFSDLEERERNARAKRDARRRGLKQRVADLEEISGETTGTLPLPKAQLSPLILGGGAALAVILVGLLLLLLLS